MSANEKKMPKSCRDLTLAQIAQIHTAPLCYARVGLLVSNAEAAVIASSSENRFRILPTEEWRDNATFKALQAEKLPRKLFLPNDTVTLAAGVAMDKFDRQTDVSAFVCLENPDIYNMLYNYPGEFAVIVETDEAVDVRVDDMVRNLTFCNWATIIGSIYKPLCDYALPSWPRDAETLYAAELLRTTNPWTLELHELPPLIQAAKVVVNAKNSLAKGGYFVSSHETNELPGADE